VIIGKLIPAGTGFIKEPVKSEDIVLAEGDALISPDASAAD